MYAASKAFMDAFTTSLHRETRGTKVHISVVRAGPVQTEFFETARNHANGRDVPAEHFAVTSQVVAERIWKLILHPRRIGYVPRWLAIVPWIELGFGWLEDSIGPMLLKRIQRR